MLSVLATAPPDIVMSLLMNRSVVVGGTVRC